MLLNPTQNSFILNSYDVLLNVFIGFASFILFFSIFNKAFFNQYIRALIQKYISDTLSNYVNIFSILNEFNLLSNVLNLFGVIQNIQTTAAKEESIVQSNNAYYDNLLLGIMGVLIGGFLLLLLLPVVLGFIPLNMLNWKYILISLVVNIGFIISFECVFLLVIIFLNNPLNLTPFFNALGY